MDSRVLIYIIILLRFVGNCNLINVYLSLPYPFPTIKREQSKQTKPKILTVSHHYFSHYGIGFCILCKGKICRTSAKYNQRQPCKRVFYSCALCILPSLEVCSPVRIQFTYDPSWEIFSPIQFSTKLAYYLNIIVYLIQKHA